MFHFELRQFPYVARAFNLTRGQLAEQILSPWVAQRPVEWEGRRWAPDRARLTIYEAEPLRPEELGQGRGWANATRAGADVTAQILSEARRELARNPTLEALKAELLGLSTDDAVDVREAVRLAGALHPGARASERLALAEQAVWELLHEGVATLVVEGNDAPPTTEEEWRTLLLAWKTWAGDGAPAIRLRSAGRQQRG